MSMENYDDINLNLNLNDLPSNEAELDLHLSPAEKRSLKDSKLSGDPKSLIEKVLHMPDSHNVALTHEELVDTVRDSQWFRSALNAEQRSRAKEFLETLVPKKDKCYGRSELLTVAKNLLLAVDK
eukprot:TRINITY_DN1575_c0_g1_i1.p1 TRINITY_DN1575_c0_g1~~TRINITY_DN1575_c0_g1_i1.p1  ORF type:complete len:125 (+),score=40.24 TRINITY_DN1575_c0_g1_i1:99-473(+)